MCRFLVFVGARPILLADLLTHPSRSIIHQSYACKLRTESHGGSASLNGDGFGVGWYTGEHVTPCVFNSIAPAWNNRNLHRLAEKVTAGLVFAHIRAASPGSPTSESNCHPFQFKNLMWMHNGGVGDFCLIKKRIVNFVSDEVYAVCQGTTDSEYCFLVFLELLTRGRRNALEPSVEAVHCTQQQLRKALEETVDTLKQWITEVGSSAKSLFNFAVTDGETVIVTRYVFPNSFPPASLFFSSGSSFARDPCDPTNFRMIQADKRQQCHIITSEPLTDDDNDWIEVPKNHMIIITPQSNLLLVSMDEGELAPIQGS